MHKLHIWCVANLSLPNQEPVFNFIDQAYFVFISLLVLLAHGSTGGIKKLARDIM